MNDQPQPDRPILKDAVPVLAVSDLQRSIDFYCETLGFELGWKWGDPPSMASVCCDQVELNLAVRDSDSMQTSSVYFVVAQVNMLYEIWKAKGLMVSAEISDQPYGMRDFDFADPDGNMICVGEAQ